MVKCCRESEDQRPYRCARNISVLEGSGGNIAVLTGRDGKLLIEAGFAVSRPQITNALLSINTDPIRHLINTHWHTDHTDGNAWLHSEGAEITAHENTKKRLLVDTRVEGWGLDLFRPCPTMHYQLKCSELSTRWTLNDTRIALKYYGPAHTDSDVWVHFTDANVVPRRRHLVETASYPFIGLLHRGQYRRTDPSCRSQPRDVHQQDSPLSRGTARWADGPRWPSFATCWLRFREDVASLKKQGRSLQENHCCQTDCQFTTLSGVSFLITFINVSRPLVLRGSFDHYRRKEGRIIQASSRQPAEPRESLADLAPVYRKYRQTRANNKRHRRTN